MSRSIVGLHYFKDQRLKVKGKEEMLDCKVSMM
jgi:hypothetical protein